MEDKRGWQELLYWTHPDLGEWYFFSVLGSGFSTKLKIPKDFGKHLGSNLPEKMILTGRKGREWPVELRTSRSSSSDKVLHGSGWHQFVQEQSLQAGDALVIRYGGDCRLHVLTFDHQSGCEKIKPIFTPNLYGSTSHIQGGSPAAKCSSSNPSEENKQNEQDIQKDTSDEWEGSHALNKKKKMPETSNSLGRGRGRPPSRGRGRGRRHSGRPPLISISTPRDASTRSFKTIVQYSNERESQSVSRSNLGSYPLIFHSSRRAVTEDERQKIQSLAYKFKSSKPFFTVLCMKPTHVTKRFVLTIPIAFIMDHLPQRTALNVNLRVAGDRGRGWEVGYEPMCGRMGGQFIRGWSDFVFDNAIEEGDAAVFELVQEDEEIVFDVHIFRVVTEIRPLEKEVIKGPRGHKRLSLGEL